MPNCRSQAAAREPLCHAFFLFCGRRRDRIKALYWEGDGFVLRYKRLDSNSVYQWLRCTEEVREISPQQYRWLMDRGVQVEIVEIVELMLTIQDQIGIRLIEISHVA